LALSRRICLKGAELGRSPHRGTRRSIADVCGGTIGCSGSLQHHLRAAPPGDFDHSPRPRTIVSGMPAPARAMSRARAHRRRQPDRLCARIDDRARPCASANSWPRRVRDMLIHHPPLGGVALYPASAWACAPLDNPVHPTVLSDLLQKSAAAAAVCEEVGPAPTRAA